MIIFSILLLLGAIFGLFLYGLNMKNRYETELRTQQKVWLTKYNALRLRYNEYKVQDFSVRRLGLEKKAMLRRIDDLENERDNLTAALAALETQDTTDRCEVLEEECKTLAQKVVSLHRDNTAIKLKLDSYHDYANKRNKVLSAAPSENQVSKVAH